jgi:hypothetical protein
MNTRSFFSRFCYSLFPRRAAVLLVTQAWCSLAFGGKIHNAAAGGDLEKVRALLRACPKSGVFSNSISNAVM